MRTWDQGHKTYRSVRTNHKETTQTVTAKEIRYLRSFWTTAEYLITQTAAVMVTIRNFGGLKSDSSSFFIHHGRCHATKTYFFKFWNLKIFVIQKICASFFGLWGHFWVFCVLTIIFYAVVSTTLPASFFTVKSRVLTKRSKDQVGL